MGNTFQFDSPENVPVAESSPAFRRSRSLALFGQSLSKVRSHAAGNVDRFLYGVGCHHVAFTGISRYDGIGRQSLLFFDRQRGSAVPRQESDEFGDVVGLGKVNSVQNETSFDVLLNHLLSVEANR
jgi:hypothetical protein